jgi:hypothetical protein
MKDYKEDYVEVHIYIGRSYCNLVDYIVCATLRVAASYPFLGVEEVDLSWFIVVFGR